MDVKTLQPIQTCLPGLSPGLVQARARGEVKKLLLDWKRRPEPREVSGFSDEDLLHGAHDAFGAVLGDIAAIEQSMTLFELKSVLPYLRMIVDYVVATFPKHRILILGRDAEPLYDALCTVLEGTPQAKKVSLVPGSNTLWSSICPDEETYLMFPGYAPVYTKDQIIRFLAGFGLTPEAFLRGEQFLVLDTGFYGSIAEKMVQTVKKVFASRVPARIITGAFHPRVIGTFYDAPYAGVLLPFQIPKESLKQLFPQTMPILEIVTPGLEKVAGFVIAIALQSLPKHHDSYSLLVDNRRNVRAVSFGPVPLERYIDRERGNVDFNRSVVNPVAAMMVQREVINYFRKVKQGLPV